MAVLARRELQETDFHFYVEEEKMKYKKQGILKFEI